MHALKYFVSEAAASLWRRRGAALVAVLTIAAGLFALGFFLLVNANLQRVVSRWGESAEISVYLTPATTGEPLKAIEEMVERSGVVGERAYVSSDEAMRRFKTDYPDLAETAATLGTNPLPASFELRVRPEVREAEGAVEGLVSALRGMQGVADVRYDREWLSRLNAIVRGARVGGGLVVVLLTIAATLTVANVVRLAAAARQDELEIMQLVGAPFAYVRGPFVAEGVLQGGIGALVALAALGATFVGVRARYGDAAGALLGPDGLRFLAPAVVVAMLVGGMVVGCAGAYAVARRVR